MTAPRTGKTTATSANAAEPRGLRSQKAIGTPEALQEIKSGRQGRKFLEENLLLVPANRTITTDMLVHCLHQIADMPGITKPITNAVRSVAHLLEENAQEESDQFIRENLVSQINEHASDWANITEDLRRKIDQRFDSRIQDLENATEKFKQKSEEIIQELATKISNQETTRPGNAVTASYSQAVIGTVPAHANPRVAAREGIRIRQIMLEGADRDTELGKKTEREIKELVNKKLTEIGAES